MVDERRRFRLDQEEFSKIHPDLRCRIAVDTALDAMLKFCGTRDAVARQMAELLGINPDDINPVSEHCMEIFKIGLTRETCRDFRFQRAWVMCNAWKLMDEKGLSFGQAIRTSWRILKDVCADKGVVV